MGFFIEFIVELFIWIFTGRKSSENNPPRITLDNGDHGNQSMATRVHRN